MIQISLLSFTFWLITALTIISWLLIITLPRSYWFEERDGAEVLRQYLRDQGCRQVRRILP